MRAVDCVIASPPYAESLNSEQHGIKDERRSKNAADIQTAHYGHEQGQLGAMRPGDTPEGSMTDTIEPVEWISCYDDNWKGIISEASFAHPAKMARGLVARIFDHLFATGRIRCGSLVVDPFGGIGTTAIEGASRGCKVVCCELEEKFYKLMLGNFDLHRKTWEAFGDPLPVAVNGDSRNLVALLGPVLAECVVSSPPYSETGSGGNMKSGAVNCESWSDGKSRKMGPSMMHGDGYGTTPGQLGTLAAGSVEAVLSSPPYVSGGHHTDVFGAWNKNGGGQGVESKDEAGYGVTDGQLGALQSGSVDDVIGSATMSVDTQQPRSQNTEPNTSADTPGDATSQSVKLGIPSSGGVCADGESCLPASTVEQLSHGAQSAVIPAPTNTSAKSSRAGRSRKATANTSQPQSEASPCLDAGGRSTLIGQEGVIHGEDSTGERSDEKQEKGTASSASTAGLTGKSKSTTSRKTLRQVGCGTTPSTTSKLSAPDAILQDTETTCLTPSAPPATKSTRQDSASATALQNAERLERLKRSTDTTPKTPSRTSASTAASNSESPGGDGNSAPENASAHPELSTNKTTARDIEREKETFWSECKKIYLECFKILKPGGALVLVVKSFVRRGEIVDFPSDTRRLCEACGFQTVEVIHASLVKRTAEASLFGGEEVKTVKRASFFRRLHEKKNPETAINHEVVLIMVKPGGDDGRADCVVSSPPFIATEGGCKEPINGWQGMDRPSGTIGERQAASGHIGYGSTAGQLGSMPLGHIEDALNPE